MYTFYDFILLKSSGSLRTNDATPNSVPYDSFKKVLFRGEIPF